MDTFIGRILGISMSFIIVFINTVLRIISITLIKWIGEDTHSQQLRSITNGVFITQFFNTAFLMLLVYANFNDAGLPLGSLFNGPFADFVPFWYVQVGWKMTQTMIINSFMPVVSFGIAWGMKFAFRLLDRSFGKDTYKTKKTSIQLYIDLYSGPEYLIHFKYSIILNISFVCMVYGVGVPLLLLVAAISFAILYATERLLVAYFYQQPPAFDDKLTKNAVAILKYASILYLLFGFWMLSNRGMFDNEVLPLEFTDSRVRTTHSIGSFTINQAIPMFFMGCVMVAIVFMQAFFKKTLKSWGFTFGGRKIQVDENLPQFWRAIKFSDAEWLIEENKYLKNNYYF